MKRTHSLSIFILLGISFFGFSVQAREDKVPRLLNHRDVQAVSAELQGRIRGC